MSLLHTLNYICFISRASCRASCSLSLSLSLSLSRARALFPDPSLSLSVSLSTSLPRSPPPSLYFSLFSSSHEPLLSRTPALLQSGLPLFGITRIPLLLGDASFEELSIKEVKTNFVLNVTVHNQVPRTLCTPLPPFLFSGDHD